MLDRLGRPLRDLRISVTDRCNMRCRYCMPREVFGPDFAFLARSQLLTFEEIERVARACVELGVCKIRLTGGEPLLRRGLADLVAMLARIEGVDDLAMTTNGLLLARAAPGLAAAGLTRATVSLDALDDRVLRRIGDTPVSSARIVAGIEAAVAAGLAPVKVNMVVRRGLNDHCIGELAAHFRHTPVVLRFIEYMDVGSTNNWRPADVVTAADIVAAIGARWPLEPLAPTTAGEVATRYRYVDGAGEIGAVSSVSGPFCGSCSRARLSADGSVFTCLFARRGHDLRTVLRAGASDEELRERLRDVWLGRGDRYSADRARLQRDGGTGPGTRPWQRPKVEMSYIGG